VNELPKYTVLVSAKARDMLFEHARFLAQASIKAGESLFDQFEEKVDSLEEMPERCASYENPCLPCGKYRKLALEKYLLIIFQVSDDTVYIDLILDARSENKTLPNF
jgi:hypothetical protein